MILFGVRRLETYTTSCNTDLDYDVLYSLWVGNIELFVLTETLVAYPRTYSELVHTPRTALIRATRPTRREMGEILFILATRTRSVHFRPISVWKSHASVANILEKLPFDTD